MKLTIYTIMAVLTLGIAGARAQEIEVPEDAPRETWQLVYDDYRSIYWSTKPEYKDLTMDVTVVRGEACLYIQGIAKSYPTSWVKIGLTDDFMQNGLLLWSNQPVTMDGSTQYINVGHMNTDYGGTIRCIYFYIISRGANSPLVLTRDLSSDKITYRADDKMVAYWPAPTPNSAFNEGLAHFSDDPVPPEEWQWPEKEVYLNPRLIDMSSGIGAVNVSDDKTYAPVYTLTGVMTDPNHLAPGIYVSRGKKIVVK